MNHRPDWIYRQSGVIPYRYKDGGIEVMLITSRKGKRWVIPKGIVEPHLTPQDSAAQEAWEEAGLVGRVSSQAIGSYRYDKWGGTCQVEVFLLQVETVLATWPEVDLRRRQWLTLEEAASRVDEQQLQQILQAVPEIIQKTALEKGQSQKK
jgi:8-oxo-dGTP pyrophosphatase MutT (NUDIX family)